MVLSRLKKSKNSFCCVVFRNTEICIQTVKKLHWREVTLIHYYYNLYLNKSLYWYFFSFTHIYFFFCILISFGSNQNVRPKHHFLLNFRAWSARVAVMLQIWNFIFKYILAFIKKIGGYAFRNPKKKFVCYIRDSLIYILYISYQNGMNLILCLKWPICGDGGYDIHGVSQK